MEHVLAEDPASPKLLGILKNQMMHELSFSAHLIKCDFDNTKEGDAPRPPPPPKIGKNMICLRKIVIFHTKYLNNFRASLRSAQFFNCTPPP